MMRLATPFAALLVSLLVPLLGMGCGSIEYGPSEPRQREAPRVARVDVPVTRVEGAVSCGGQQRLRIDDQVLDGSDGPAVQASGQCVVEISESIVRGQPAVVVSGQAQVVLVECRIEGDLVSQGQGQIRTPGSRHRGQVLRAAY